MHATITLDSGAFLQDIDQNPVAIDVGYFQCGKDNSGKDVPDIRAYADGESTAVRHEKLGNGRISVTRTKSGAPVTGVKISDSLKQHLLRKKDLYGDPAPNFDPNKIECTIHFTSGDFCCSMVKDRRFIEVPVSGGNLLSESYSRPIAHNVVVHYNLEADEELRVERDKGTVLFSTRDVSSGTKHVQIELVANNATAVQFFREALDLKGRTSCWLPNQGDPPPTGGP